MRCVHQQDKWLHPFTGSPAGTGDTGRHSLPLWFMAVISLVIGIAGYSIFSYQKQLIKQDGERQLAVIAALKVKQITNWLDERKGDALALGGQSHIAGLMGEHRKTGALAETKKQWLRARLKTIQKAYHYDSVCLLDSDGKEFLSSSDTLKPAHHDAGLVRAAIHEKKTQISELHLTEGGKPELDLVAPLVAGEMEPRSISGLLQLRIDLNQFLFPLLQSWPVPSNTAETLLIRREGNSVLFLNELRHLPDSAMKLSRPLVHSLPAARAAQGEKGIMYGVDYRGKPVAAHAQPVPGTSWAIIAKIDEDEMYAPIRRVGFYVALVAILLTIFTNATLFFWWRQRRAEFTAQQMQALLEKKALAQHFDYLSKYANDIIVLTDRDGLIVEANDRALEAYGLRREEFLGTYAHAYRTGEARSQFAEDWQQLIERGHAQYETQHRHRDGTPFPVEISLRTFEIEGQVFVQAIIRDITERKKAEEALFRHQQHLEEVVATRTAALQKAQMALEHTNQALQVRSEEAEAASRAKGAFLANMSHELRTPLHAVIGFSRLMSNDPVISAPQKRNLEIIHHAGNHLLTLIDEILEYSKIESGYLRVATVNTHLDSLLRELTGMLEAHAKEAGLTLMLETSGLPACIGIDAHKLRQVLINLLTNAIKYTKEGGVILKVSGKQKEDKQVELDFAVSDTGIGIASESLENIFEPFIQTAPSGRQGGTGLGLSISRQYVRLMGGELTVTSVLDKGSVFRFMLKVPRIDTLEGAVQLPPYDGGPPEKHFPWRILLVDDDDDGREEFRKMLERSGYTVMEAENATEAENCLGVFQPELVFMDWQMPGINGVEASRRIRARTDITQPVIVMLTAYSFEENRNAAVSAGIDDFVSKPVTKETVQAILKHWLNNKSQSHFPQRHISPAKEREPGKLDTLPADVRKRLSQAVIELNPEKIAAAIASIEAIQPETYHHLKALADALQYARIGRLLDIDGFEDM